MPMITVKMFPGRTDAQKETLVEEITAALVRTCHAERAHVWVVIEEVPREHWAIGGKLYSELPATTAVSSLISSRPHLKKRTYWALGAVFRTLDGPGAYCQDWLFDDS